MRFVRFIPHGRFHDCKPRAMPLDLTTIGFGFLAVVVVLVIVTLALPAALHSWARYPAPVLYFYPAYPQHELEQGIGGEVAVRFTINRQGEVTSILVLDNGGSEALATAVREAVGAARYRAQRSARYGDLPGLPIEVTVTQRFLFDAEGMAERDRQFGWPMPCDQVVYGDFDTLPVPETTVLPEELALHDPRAVLPPPGRPWSFRQYLVHLTVTPQGEVTFPRLHFGSLGYRSNRRAVEAAIRGIRYTPATRNGVPVYCNITQLFELPTQFGFQEPPADRSRIRQR